MPGAFVNYKTPTPTSASVTCKETCVKRTWWVDAESSSLQKSRVKTLACAMLDRLRPRSAVKCRRTLATDAQQSHPIMIQWRKMSRLKKKEAIRPTHTIPSFTNRRPLGRVWTDATRPDAAHCLAFYSTLIPSSCCCFWEGKCRPSNLLTWTNRTEMFFNIHLRYTCIAYTKRPDKAWLEHDITLFQYCNLSRILF